MSTTVSHNIGCTFCGNTFTITSPDSIHTVAYRSGREGPDIFDYVLMKAKCPECKSNNWIYWYRPLNFWWFNPLWFINTRI
jgi:phage FluMu protein Com